MLFQRVLATFVLASLTLSAETDFRFAFPQSELLLGVDLKWLIKSPFGETMRKELKANIGELKPLEMLIDQIDTVHLSVVSKSAKGSDLLMLVQGRFEAEKLVELAARNGFRMEQWGKIRVLLPMKSKPAPLKKVAFQKAQFKMDVASSKPSLALVDSKNIVIGEEAPLRVALERMETGLTPQANPLFERARDLEAANDIWLIGNTAPLNLNAGGAKSNDPMSQLAGQVRSFALGVAVRRNIAMDLQLITTNPKAAAQMLDLAKGVIAMAKMNANPVEGLPVDLDKALQLSATGNVVKATLSIDQQEVDKLMASGLFPGLGKSKAASAPSVGSAPIFVAATPQKALVAQAQKPAVPTRKTVIIYGLAGGPKEVPVQ